MSRIFRSSSTTRTVAATGTSCVLASRPGRRVAVAVGPKWVSRSACGGEPNGESGSTGRVGFCVDGAAVRGDECFDDGEADTAAGSGAGGTAAPEPLEDVGQFVCGDSGAGVGHGDRGVRAVASGPDGDGAARWSELRGVGEEVHRYL